MFTCVWTRMGSAYCFGTNDGYTIGAGGATTAEFAASSAPRLPLPGGISVVAAGGSHTCAIAAGELYCWGLGSDSQNLHVVDVRNASDGHVDVGAARAGRLIALSASRRGACVLTA